MQPEKISPCSLELISHGTVFFSHNKIASAGLSAGETISRTGRFMTIVKILILLSDFTTL
jgi:hypothetical protein